ncbi:hypothetical protein QE385_003662 [Sphingomonas sp. SORGH_AS 950]|uniref:hypothetical protein n=1 Tax=Sphingomonas sp. SORGH_AS_0950 TaxID=3041792 RepID=UPI00278B5F7B|nr:hypothetical protein [Sphingomonas sp. SORGH_AS_0950]MDQ1159335.1 hypothetical protein [Sphingomonas sp. SORGH_AS_0950]
MQGWLTAGAKPKKASKIHMAVTLPGHLLAVLIARLCPFAIRLGRAVICIGNPLRRLDEDYKRYAEARRTTS